MSVGWDGSTDILKRTANLPAATAFTMCGWACRTSFRASAYQYFAALEDKTNNAGSYCVLGWSNLGAMQVSTSATSVDFGTDVDNNTWFFWALLQDSSKAYGRRALVGDSALTGVSCTGASFTPAVMSLGNDSYGEYCNVYLADVKVWGAVLTDAELLVEMGVYEPIRRTNLTLWSPLLSASDLKDWSGNGYNWTSGGTLTTQADPPVTWRGVNNFPLLRQAIYRM